MNSQTPQLTDPVIPAKRLRDECLSLLRTRDLTADECAGLLRESILSVRPRISELHADGLIFRTTLRRPNRSGHSAAVWTTRAGHETRMEDGRLSVEKKPLSKPFPERRVNCERRA